MSHSFSKGPEHAFLVEKVGVWDIQCEYFFDPTADPMRATGVETIESLGPFWSLANSTFELPGGITLRGQCSTGFDPVIKMFRSTWIDTATPFLYLFEGLYDGESRLLELSGDNIDPQTGELVPYRSKELFGGPDDRIFELLVEASPGLETQILRYEYTRRR